MVAIRPVTKAEENYIERISNTIRKPGSFGENLKDGNKKICNWQNSSGYYHVSVSNETDAGALGFVTLCTVAFSRIKT